MKNLINLDIKTALKDKVERVYIIGSFQNEDWNRCQSDIDLVCIDSSFVEFPYFVNLYYVKDCLAKLPFKFDIFLYTRKQFYAKMRQNPRFRDEINNSVLI
ncbi:MAG: nucleotidyltransferase domain-containing protein [Acidobacteriia bacterium]|nr:nucleotidyltransferase domain-containing protein [Terriglobia bacterium]